MHSFHFLWNNKKSFLSESAVEPQALSLDFFGGLLETSMANLVSLIWSVCAPTHRPLVSDQTYLLSSGL